MKCIFHRAGLWISARGALRIAPLPAGLEERPAGLEDKLVKKEGVMVTKEKSKGFVFPFEKLEVWQLAVDLADYILGLLETFPTNKYLRLVG